MDMKFNNEYCIITDKSGKIILAQKVTGRVETGHTITKYTDLIKIPISKLPVLKVGEVQEPDKLYVVDGKVSIIEKEPITIKLIDEGSITIKK